MRIQSDRINPDPRQNFPTPEFLQECMQEEISFPKFVHSTLEIILNNN